MSQISIPVIALLVLCGDITRQTDAAAKGPIKKESWTPLCALSKVLNASTKALRALISKITTRAHEAELMYSRLAVYTAALDDNEEKKMYLPFLLTLRERAEEHTEAMKGPLNHATESVTHALYVAGAIDEFASVLKQTAKDATHTCIGNTADTGLAAAEAATALAGCTASPGDNTLNAAGFAPDKLKLTDNRLQLQEDTHTAKDCFLTDDSAAGDAHHTTNLNGAPLNLANGLLKLTDTQSTLIATAEPTQLSDATTAVSKAQWALKQLMGTRAATDKSKANLTADDLIGSSNFAAYVAKVYKVEQSAAAQLIDDKFGAAGSDFRKNFWTRIELMSAPAEATGLKQSSNLIDITDLKTLHLAQIYYKNQMWSKAAEQTKELKKLQRNTNKQDSKSTEEKEKECSAAGDDQKACEKLKDKGCVFNKDGKHGKK
ncbi:Trypanosome variant surface glycoprotein (A-type) [Trypanosoma brucei equiperdum]|uniref:Trypanosome variant surface glycoprotein (A-type) n=1 Tax=Trypanosoma brucei equiperdum TaxID=630700 RepID=A0A3L6L8W1_9TRYP|nr:Trypanosome variant surface glycoprotein (A-type) [Trypanosoma brucei equiperdum]